MPRDMSRLTILRTASAASLENYRPSEHTYTRPGTRLKRHSMRLESINACIVLSDQNVLHSGVPVHHAVCYAVRDRAREMFAIPVHDPR